MPNRTVLLLGATGLVGGHALRVLSHDPAWGRVVTLGRREMPLASPRHAHHVVDFDRLDAHADLFACDAVACCLGTTIRTAGSRAAFRRVDLELPRETARRARAAGATAAALVSAYGADAGSRIFYNRVKGEAETALEAVGFPSLTVLRPSLLDGERDEVRLGERVGLAVLRPLAPLLVGPLRPLRPTPAESVARALAASLAAAPPGVHRLGPDAIRARAAEQRAGGAR